MKVHFGCFLSVFILTYLSYFNSKFVGNELTEWYKARTRHVQRRLQQIQVETERWEVLEGVEQNRQLRLSINQNMVIGSYWHAVTSSGFFLSGLINVILFASHLIIIEWKKNLIPKPTWSRLSELARTN